MMAFYQLCAHACASIEGAKRGLAEEPIKQSDHVMDPRRYALHGKHAAVAHTEAYLAEMRRRVEGV
jgi:hypothetical protein